MTCSNHLIIGCGIEYSQLLYVLYPHVIHSEESHKQAQHIIMIELHVIALSFVQILMPVARPMVATVFQLLAT